MNHRKLFSVLYNCKFADYFFATPNRVGDCIKRKGYGQHVSYRIKNSCRKKRVFNLKEHSYSIQVPTILQYRLLLNMYFLFRTRSEGSSQTFSHFPCSENRLTYQWPVSVAELSELSNASYKGM